MLAGLALAGCADEPTLPPEVENLARQREEAERIAREDLEQKRRDGNLSLNTEAPSVGSPESPEQPASDGTASQAEPGSDEEDAATVDEVAPPPVPVAPPAVRESAAALRWEQMRANMTTAEVIALLGQPTRVASDVYVDYWYYGQGRSAGRIAFVRAFQTKTIAWDPPVD